MSFPEYHFQKMYFKRLVLYVLVIHLFLSVTALSNQQLELEDTNRERRKLDMTFKGYGYVCNEKEINNIIKAKPIKNSNCPNRNWLIPFLESV